MYCWLRTCGLKYAKKRATRARCVNGKKTRLAASFGAAKFSSQRLRYSFSSLFSRLLTRSPLISRAERIFKSSRSPFFSRMILKDYPRGERNLIFFTFSPGQGNFLCRLEVILHVRTKESENLKNYFKFAFIRESFENSHRALAVINEIWFSRKVLM